MTGAAKTHMSHDGVSAGGRASPVSASTAHLNVNGTEMVASLATSNSTVAQTTRIFRSVRSEGQMYGHRPIIVRQSAPRSAEILKLAGLGGAFIGGRKALIVASHIGGSRPRRILRDGVSSVPDVQNQRARLYVRPQDERARSSATNDREQRLGCRRRRACQGVAGTMRPAQNHNGRGIGRRLRGRSA